jgi:hypothetical protein
MLLFVPARQIRYIATNGIKCRKGDKNVFRVFNWMDAQSVTSIPLFKLKKT